MRANVLILGKSGSGKSTLVNYLLGSELAEASAGRPVTPREKGADIAIYRYPPIRQGDLEVVVHDSWGMEADQADKWRKLLVAETAKHDCSEDIGDWFHTLIYCVGAKGARVEDFEIEQILRPAMDLGHTVMFVLTKSDIASDAERLGIHEVLASECAGHSGIVEVSSLSTKLRNGTCTQSFGRSELLEELEKNFIANLRAKVRSQFLIRSDRSAQEWKRRTLKDYDERIRPWTSYQLGLKKVSEWADHRFGEMVQGLDAWYEAKIKEADLLLASFRKEVLNVLPKDRRNFEGARHLAGIDRLEWEGAEVAANVVMNLIPVINIVYLFVGKEMHRDCLEEKLDTVIAELLSHLKTELAKQEELPFRKIPPACARVVSI